MDDTAGSCCCCYRRNLNFRHFAPAVPNRLLLLPILAAVIGLVWWAEAVADPQQVIFDDIIARAADEATRPYSNDEGNVPDFLRDLTYDQWRDIRFRKEEALWREENLPFEIQFFHPGLYYNRIVKMNTIGDEGVRPYRFSSNLFDYGANRIGEKIPADFGFAGFRLHYRLKNKHHLDEVAVFLGASYFRAIGSNQVFGLSARGLAIDTGLESGEEFPYFKEFWLEEPGPEAREITFYALLDSKRLTGAYRFSLRPGVKTDMRVEGHLFRREDVHKIGIAPLTSMFFYGENNNKRPVDDFRPEVHDSDGLLVINGSGERIWRPLVNPQHLFINSFQSNALAGFALLQRDLNFDHYQDQETQYNLRPSALVVPIGDWGPGHVELVQIPTENETNDNIVAYWVPDRLPEKEKPVVFSYVLSWHTPLQDPIEVGQAVATRSVLTSNESRRILVDFQGGKLDSLPAQLPSEAPIEAIISVNEEGEITDHQLYKIKANDTWRLAFQVRRKAGETLAESLSIPILKRPPLEVQAHLVQGENRLTETWSYAVWP